MFTLLADAMSVAALAKRGFDVPEHLKDHADRHVPSHKRKRHAHNPYRNLW